MGSGLGPSVLKWSASEKHGSPPDCRFLDRFHTDIANSMCLFEIENQNSSNSNFAIDIAIFTLLVFCSNSNFQNKTVVRAERARTRSKPVRAELTFASAITNFYSSGSLQVCPRPGTKVRPEIANISFISYSTRRFAGVN